MIKLLELREVTLTLPGTGKEPEEEWVFPKTSLTLIKGERLAVVGDSHRLSVLRQALLGKLPKQYRVKGGELFCRGEDLFQVSAKERQRLGAEISMISQDPSASFDPALLVGVQLTEAIGRWQQGRFSRSQGRFERVMKVLKEEMLLYASSSGREEGLKVCERFEILRRVCQEGARMDREFTQARDRLTMLQDLGEELKGALLEKRPCPVKEQIHRIRSLGEIHNPWLFQEEDEKTFSEKLEKACSLGESFRKGGEAALIAALEEMLQVSELAFDGRGADFYGIAYLLEQGEQVCAWQEPMEELFDSASRHFGEAFLNDFCVDLAGVSEAIQERCQRQRGHAAQVLEECLPLFEDRDFGRGASQRQALKEEAQRALSDLEKQWKDALSRSQRALEECIDPLEMGRESREHTFGDYLGRLMGEYLEGERKNGEIKRAFVRREALYQKHLLLRLFRKPPQMEALLDTSTLRQRMVSLIEGLARDCKCGALDSQQWDIERAQEILDDLLETSREAFQKPSCVTAHCRAMELLREVGIEDPAQVMELYPRQLSRNQLQRVELALALVSGPRILLWNLEDQSAGDLEEYQEGFLKRLQRIKKARRLTLLMTTPCREKALALADRIVEL